MPKLQQRVKGYNPVIAALLISAHQHHLLQEKHCFHFRESQLQYGAKEKKDTAVHWEVFQKWFKPKA